MGPGGVAAESGCFPVRSTDGIGFVGEMSRIGLSRAHGRNQVTGKWDLIDSLPVATEGEVGLSIGCDHGGGVNGVRICVWSHFGSVACSCLDDDTVIMPIAGSRCAGGCNSNGTITTSGSTDTVVTIVYTIYSNDGRCPRSSTITLSNDTISVQHAADMLPWTIHAWGGMNEDMLADIV